ncbi:MAG: DUF5688 family protein [Lachnospiraceae bacterium]|nr:DUF5688 family protein [Lachnospiraceae bacterium]
MSNVHITDQVSQELLAAIQAAAEAMRAEMEIALQTVEKNNGVEKTSITVGTGNIRPSINIDRELEMIRSGEASIQECADAIVSKIRSLNLQEGVAAMSPHVSDMMERPDKARITLAVVSKSQNEKLLKETPHRDLAGDLAVIARYQVSDEGTTVIKNSLAQSFGMTSSEVIEAGMKNISHDNYQVRSMSSILSEMMGIPEDALREMQGIEQDAKMFVVTNENKLYGATGIFVDRDLRQQVAETIGEDFYIIPSSIHEVICVPADQMGPEEAAEMIRSVNGTEVAPEEVLSDHPYLVDAQTLKICNPCSNIVEADFAAERMAMAAHM